MAESCVSEDDHTGTDLCVIPHVVDGSEEAFGFGDDLELNQFDGLPYSSRYYKLLTERKSLSVWKVRCEFLDLLVNNQLVIISGTTKTGKSSQVRGSLLLQHYIILLFNT